MIQVGVLSNNPRLVPLLSSVLSPHYLVFQVRIPGGAGPREHQADHLDVTILDLDPEARPSAWSDLYNSVKSRFAAPVIVMADDQSRDQALALVERGAHGFVRRPPVVRELKTLLESVHVRESVPAAFDHLTGSSAPMQVVYKLISRVANLEASVLIDGESGTGKELIARAIHNAGSRAKHPFVAVSCGAIPEALIEAELFGHEKGAFTGSLGAREGYFESAADGTLFLDEIGELTPNMQIKLLRVLQQREFNRLGSNRPIPLRARVVLATHRDLERMVTAGEFRQDLFYRINVMTISAPPLRDRGGDIPLLAWHFLRQYSTQYGKSVTAIEPEALRLLRAYSWPGNVRELENTMQRAIIMADGDSIRTVDLPEAIHEPAAGAPAEEDAQPEGSFERLLRDYKIKLAHDAIQQCNGNKTLAAQSLSISRAYLHRLIRPPAAGTESNARAASGGR